MQKVKIKNLRVDGNGSSGEIYIDGREVEGVTAIKIHASVNETPKIIITLTPQSFEIEGNVEVIFNKEES